MDTAGESTSPFVVNLSKQDDSWSWYVWALIIVLVVILIYWIGKLILFAMVINAFSGLAQMGESASSPSSSGKT
jgi:hypothetical protein